MKLNLQCANQIIGFHGLTTSTMHTFFVSSVNFRNTIYLCCLTVKYYVAGVGLWCLPKICFRLAYFLCQLFHQLIDEHYCIVSCTPFCGLWSLLLHLCACLCGTSLINILLLLWFLLSTFRTYVFIFILFLLYVCHILVFCLDYKQGS